MRVERSGRMCVCVCVCVCVSLCGTVSLVVTGLRLTKFTIIDIFFVVLDKLYCNLYVTSKFRGS